MEKKKQDSLSKAVNKSPTAKKFKSQVRREVRRELRKSDVSERAKSSPIRRERTVTRGISLSNPFKGGRGVSRIKERVRA